MGVDGVVSSQVAYHLKVSLNNAEHTHSVILISDLTFTPTSFQWISKLNETVGRVNEKYYQLYFSKQMVLLLVLQKGIFPAQIFKEFEPSNKWVHSG